MLLIFKMSIIEIFTRTNSSIQSIIKGKSTSGFTFVDNFVEIEAESEDELLLKALDISDKQKIMIVLNENIKTLLTPTQLLDTIEFILLNLDFDIFYLSRHSDLCRKNEVFKNFNKIDFVKVESPHGIDALIISPFGKEKINGKLDSLHGRGSDFILNAMCEKMNNYSAYPPLINFDLSRRINNTELIKGCLCRDSFYELKPPKKTKRNTSVTNLFWFLFFLFFIIFAAFSTMKLFKTEETTTKKNSVEKLPKGPYDPLGELKT